MFVAGTNFAPATATGTGFFLGRSGIAFSVFTEEPLRDFYALKIFKEPNENGTLFEDIPEHVDTSFRNLQFGRDFMNEFVTDLIDLANEQPFEAELCHEEHCCWFSIDHEAVESNSTFHYRLVAFYGDRTYSGWGDKKLVICGVISCNDETLDSCGRLPNDDLDRVTFNFIEITTNFNRYGVLMMPNSLDMKMHALDVGEFWYDEIVASENIKTSTMTLIQPHSDLQSFALYGHDYEVEEEFDFDGSGGDDGSGWGEGSGSDEFLSSQFLN